MFFQGSTTSHLSLARLIRELPRWAYFFAPSANFRRKIMQVTTITPQPIRYVSEKVVSEMTGTPTSTLQKDRHFRRGIPYCKIGKNVRYNLADVVAYMESRKISHGE